MLSRRQFLAASATVAATPLLSRAADKKPLKLVLIGGSMSHGPGDHEFNAGVKLLAKCLASNKMIAVEVVNDGYPKDDSILDDATAIMCYADGGGGHPFLKGKNLEKIGKLVAKGTGIMFAHYAVEVPKDIGAKEFREWIGGCYEHEYSCNPMWSPEFKEFPKHEICNGVKPFSIRDEWYFNMRFRDKMEGVTPILTAVPDEKVRNGPYVYPKGPYKHIQDAKGNAEHMMWATERKDGGRGVGFTGGHIHANWKDDNFRKVVLNALLWICSVDIPKDGVQSTVTDEDIKVNLDPKKK